MFLCDREAKMDHLQLFEKQAHTGMDELTEPKLTPYHISILSYVDFGLVNSGGEGRRPLKNVWSSFNLIFSNFRRFYELFEAGFGLRDEAMKSRSFSPGFPPV